MQQSLANCRLVEFPTLREPRGHLTAVEAERQVPFPVRRVYFVYGVPAGSRRGHHAHKDLDECLVAVAGSFEVTLTDGHDKRAFKLDSPARGLHVSPMIWRDLDNFAPGTICLVLASMHFDSADYISDYDEYLQAIARPG